MSKRQLTPKGTNRVFDSFFPYVYWITKYASTSVVSNCCYVPVKALTGIIRSLRSGLSWFHWWVSFAPEFQCCYFYESSCLFSLSFNSEFYVSKIMHLLAKNLPRKPNNKVSKEPRQN